MYPKFFRIIFTILLLSSYLQLEKPYQKRKGWRHIRRCDNAHYCNLAAVCHVLCLQNSSEHFVIYKQRKSLSLLLSFMKYYLERKRQRKGGEDGGRRRRGVGERQSYAAFPNCRIYLKFFFPTHVCAQSYPTLCDPMECSLPASSVWEISRQKY